MKIDRALLIRTNHELSIQYSQDCIASCEKHKLPYEIVEGIQDRDCKEAFKLVGTFPQINYYNKTGHCCCHASHIKAWKRILEIGKPCILLEHDAIVVGDVRSIDLPEGLAVTTFGHRVSHLSQYKPIGPAKRCVNIGKTMGVHACALTPLTTEWLVNTVTKDGIGKGNDAWLMGGESGIPVFTCDPAQVVCWVRQCTTFESRGVGDLRNTRPDDKPLPKSWYVGGGK